MEKITRMCYVFLVLWITSPSVSAEYMKGVATVTAEGKTTFIPVKRGEIQKKLNQMKAEPNGPTLYLPEGAIFPDQPVDTHPLIVDVAEVTFTDIEEAEVDNPMSYVSTRGIEVTITIPFLAVAPGGPLDYSLGIAVLYDGRRRGIPQPDFLYTYIPVESIDISGGTVTVMDRGGQMSITFDTTTTCEDAVDVEDFEDLLNLKNVGAAADVRGDFIENDDAADVRTILDKHKDDVAGVSRSIVDLFMKTRDVAAEVPKTKDVRPARRLERSDDELPDSFIFSLGRYPDDGFCWFYPAGKTEFCDDIEVVTDLVPFFGANMCLAWYSDNEVYCETMPGEVRVTGWFQDLVPISEPTQAVAADQYYGDYEIDLKFPCA